jgi:hypothetical protein
MGKEGAAAGCSPRSSWSEGGDRWLSKWVSNSTVSRVECAGSRKYSLPTQRGRSGQTTLRKYLGQTLKKGGWLGLIPLSYLGMPPWAVFPEDLLTEDECGRQGSRYRGSMRGTVWGLQGAVIS